MTAFAGYHGESGVRSFPGFSVARIPRREMAKFVKDWYDFACVLVHVGPNVRRIGGEEAPMFAVARPSSSWSEEPPQP
ncbi:unnamed protein product [Calypogeia fissa]